MHPALSVIFFTTMSGAGYGLAFLLALGLGEPFSTLTKTAWFVALALISIGLLSSTLHLGNPQRAWRAFSQWRSSWLSREGCLAVITFVPLCILAAMSIFGDTYSDVIGTIAAVLCVATVYCTAMIYASLRTVISWHTRLTPMCYLAFALTSGLLLYRAFFATNMDTYYDILPFASVLLLIVAWFLKFLWVRRNARVGYGTSSMETATGLGHIGKVRLLERPHSMGNYLTNEMGFRVARKHSDLLWRISILLGLFAPSVLIGLALVLPGSQMLFFPLAAIAHMLGVGVERWLFFATARHAVALYYGGEEALVPA